MPDETQDGMRDFYEKYYSAIATSQANAIYCERLFGKDMGQHGFAEVAHLNHLIEVAHIKPEHQVLDLGCGNGKIAEYISDCTGAQVTGIDFIPSAIQQAQERTRLKSSRLNFQVMDIGHLEFHPGSFDVLVSVDTLYFIKLEESLPGIFNVLKPGGQLATFYSYSWEPWTPLENFDKSATHPDRTDLAVLLKKLGLTYQYWDYTEKDLDHAHRKEKISQELEDQFEAEGNHMLYDSHIDEARGIQKAFSVGAHARYLYLVRKESQAKK
jgi:ubiquinone/menaquinone biosynthesis C-methylase UbiE